MPKIHDEFTALPIHRARKYQLRHQRDGLCILCCTERQDGDPIYCHAHRQEHRPRSLFLNRIMLPEIDDVTNRPEV